MGLFDQLGERKRVAVTADGRDIKGRWVAGPPASSVDKRKATLYKRNKGDAQTPNMNFAGKVNWIVRMLSGHTTSNYIFPLRAHPARANLSEEDELAFRALEDRALEIERAATQLAREIAIWNRKKKMRKMK